MWVTANDSNYQDILKMIPWLEAAVQIRHANRITQNYTVPVHGQDRINGFLKSGSVLYLANISMC